jgi:hypothetical protein
VLPSHLKYAFLDEGGRKQIIISSSLSFTQEKQVLKVLRGNEGAIGCALTDLKCISHSFCIHKIYMDEAFSPVAQPQQRLNPTTKEVLRKEVIKLLEASMIYQIYDSERESLVQVVPKKGGMNV